jgi:hypothetical protein
MDDPVRRLSMGRAGRQRIEQLLGWPASARRYEALYAGLLAGSRPHRAPETGELVLQEGA